MITLSISYLRAILALACEQALSLPSPSEGLLAGYFGFKTLNFGFSFAFPIIVKKYNWLSKGCGLDIFLNIYIS